MGTPWSASIATLNRKVSRLFVCLFIALVSILGCETHGWDGYLSKSHDVLLGQTLFFDGALSADGETSCASCHRPDRAYADGLTHAKGAFGRVGVRNTPSLLDDGR